MSFIYNGVEFNHGDIINCYVENICIENAHLCIEGDRYYVCHDNVRRAGSTPSNINNRFGHPFGWTFYINQGELTEEVTNLTLALSLKRKSNINIDVKFNQFFEQTDISFNFHHFFSSITGLFDEFNTVKISDKSGFVEITSPSKIFKGKVVSGKKVEVKFARFLRSIIDSFNKALEKTSNVNDKKMISIISDSIIEKINNKFVSFQSGGLFKVEILSGDRIDEGYNKENYVKGGSTLHKSCMTDQFSFLNLYKKNKCVELAVIKNDEDKILARALVWTVNGKKYHDRIYYSSDWAEPLMNIEFNKLSIHSIKSLSSVEIKLEEWKFDKYPYLDTLYSLDMVNGILMNPRNGYATLRRTDGGYSR